MRILLIGEFSGVHVNLKRGLEALGHEVVLFSGGDSYKGFNSDGKILDSTPFGIGKIKNLINLMKNIDSYIGYDVVQFISPFSFPASIFFSGIVPYIFKKNKAIIYYACGTDPYYYKAKSYLEYFPYRKPKKYSLFRKIYFKWFINHVDQIVPAAYSYYLAHKDSPKCKQLVQMPGSGDYASKIVPKGQKLKILFGITRRDFKGAEYIEEALSRIEKRFPDKVEIKIVERLPFDEYKKLLDSVDILIDQCKSTFYGMNAIFGMERGVIVLTGNVKEAKDLLGHNGVLPINIEPDTDLIFKQIVGLIKKDDFEINSLKENSLKHVKSYHESKKVASKFESIYKKHV